MSLAPVWRSLRREQNVVCQRMFMSWTTGDDLPPFRGSLNVCPPAAKSVDSAALRSTSNDSKIPVASTCCDAGRRSTIRFRFQSTNAFRTLIWLLLLLLMTQGIRRSAEMMSRNDDDGDGGDRGQSRRTGECNSASFSPMISSMVKRRLALGVATVAADAIGDCIETPPLPTIAVSGFQELLEILNVYLNRTFNQPRDLTGNWSISWRILIEVRSTLKCILVSRINGRNVPQLWRQQICILKAAVFQLELEEKESESWVLSKRLFSFHYTYVVQLYGIPASDSTDTHSRLIQSSLFKTSSCYTATCDR